MNEIEETQDDITPKPKESIEKKHKSDSKMLTESKNITHDGIQGYKKKLFIALRHKTLLIIFIWSVYLIKILFSFCFTVLLLSYIVPNLVSVIFKGFDRNELQDFLLKIIAGGFFNQLFANVFGSKKEK